MKTISLVLYAVSALLLTGYASYGRNGAQDGGSQQPVVASRTYSYNPAGQLRETALIESNGDKTGVLYKYVTDIPAPCSDPLHTLLRDSNYVDLPLEIIMYRIPAGTADTIVLAAERPQYVYLAGAGAKLSARKIFHPENSFSLAQYRNDPDLYLDTESEYQYAPGGNIRQITRRDGTVTSYLWGYGSLYLIAEIKGTAFSSLVLPDGYSPDSDDSSYYESAGTFLRSNNSGALITSFTHSPLVGPLSETDPAGRTVRYAYDPATNRLIRETDMDGNIIQSYRYNIINQ